MKLILRTALLTVMLLVAALGTAATQAGATTLCKENVAFECPEEQRYGTGTDFTALLKAGTTTTFEGGTFEVRCNGSGWEVEIGDNPSKSKSEPVLGTLRQFTFSECSYSLGSCTVSSVKLPYAADFYSTGPGGSGKLELHAGSAHPTVSIACTGLPTCNYASEKVDLSISAGKPASVSAVEELFTAVPGQSFLCGSSVEWNAGYTITKAEEPEESTVFGPPLYIDSEP